MLLWTVQILDKSRSRMLLNGSCWKGNRHSQEKLVQSFCCVTKQHFQQLALQWVSERGEILFLWALQQPFTPGRNRKWAATVSFDRRTVEENRHPQKRQRGNFLSGMLPSLVQQLEVEAALLCQHRSVIWWNTSLGGWKRLLSACIFKTNTKALHPFQRV